MDRIQVLILAAIQFALSNIDELNEAMEQDFTEEEYADLLVHTPKCPLSVAETAALQRIRRYLDTRSVHGVWTTKQQRLDDAQYLSSVIARGMEK